jgi:tetratricopeptide (TPR) repeat protein
MAMQRGDFAGAVPLFEQSLAIKRQVFSPGHAQLMVALSNLAHAFREAGRADDALAPAEEAYRIAQASLGQDQPQRARYLIALALVHLARNHPDLAEPLARDALRLRRLDLPEQAVPVSAAKSILGAVLTALGRLDEAEILLVDAARLLKDGAGAEGREARSARERLAALQAARARPPLSRTAPR